VRACAHQILRHFAPQDDVAKSASDNAFHWLHVEQARRQGEAHETRPEFGW